MKDDTKDLFRLGASIVLFVLSCLAFYYSLFWGWASGAGVNQPALKTASNVALVISFLSFWTSVGIWLVSFLLSRRKKNSVSKVTQAS